MKFHGQFILKIECSIITQNLFLKNFFGDKILWWNVMPGASRHFNDNTFRLNNVLSFNVTLNYPIIKNMIHSQLEQNTIKIFLKYLTRVDVKVRKPAKGFQLKIFPLGIVDNNKTFYQLNCHRKSQLKVNIYDWQFNRLNMKGLQNQLTTIFHSLQQRVVKWKVLIHLLSPSLKSLVLKIVFGCWLLSNRNVWWRKSILIIKV